MKNIYTHDGAFHPDEVLAVTLLNNAGFDYPVIRTRDENILAQATNECFTLDVGGVYDGKTLFDHHQAKVRDHKCYGLSSAGLIAEYLGIDDPKLVEFIKFVDTRDTRSSHYETHWCDLEGKEVEALVSDYQPQNHPIWDGVCNMIVDLNNININSDAQERAFYLAVEMMGDYIFNWDFRGLKRCSTRLKERKEAIFIKRKEELLTITQNGNKLYIGEYVPSHKLPNDWAFFMSYDEGQQAWTVMANTKEGHVLSQGQGNFVHTNGFVGKFKSTAWGHWYDGSDGFKDAVFFKEEGSNYRYEVPVGNVYYR